MPYKNTKEEEITREKIKSEEKRKVQGWLTPILHKKAKMYATILEIDMQDFLAQAIEFYCEKLDKETGNQHIKNLIER